MNFVDVQPKSFLDYAWTSPTPPSAMSTSKPPCKTSRKQNRCCDQCRKGKRACDATILEDCLFDEGGDGVRPSVFHYSDVYGPLAACGNCEKTKKSCTFEWLRSQRLAQATQTSPNPLPTPKRRRTSGDVAASMQNANGISGQLQCERETYPLGTTGTENWIVASPFGDFPGVPVSSIDSNPTMMNSATPTVWHDNDLGYCTGDWSQPTGDVSGDDAIATRHGPGGRLSIESQSKYDQVSLNDGASCLVHDDDASNCADGIATEEDGAVARAGRKRRRRSSSLSRSNDGLPFPAVSFAADFQSLSNQAVLREGLLELYHDSFEYALSCWLTERTCPYSTKADISRVKNGGPSWNRIYHRVFRLDRVASATRGRRLTSQEDEKATKALNTAVFSFATQWAQSSERGRAKYPFKHGAKEIDSAGHSANQSPSGTKFDRKLQITAWNEARTALQHAGDIESFRLVLAQIVFSLTQKPHDYPQNEHATLGVPADRTRSDSGPADSATEGCEDLMSRLHLAIDTDDPPVQLEKAVRLIHSLRSRLVMSSAAAPPDSCNSRCSKPHKSVANKIDTADLATVDLLFWLGVMFDTLSSAMHKRSLVLSDEDSNVYANTARTAADRLQHDIGSIVPTSTEGAWDVHLSAHQRSRLQQNPVRWPCSVDDAATLLCDAAPIKVLLFRKVTRIQTLLSRGCLGEKIERAIKAALGLCELWEKLYAPFVADCIRYHDSLPSRIQSWYICLTGHWHLAALLLADIIEIVDDAHFGMEIQQMLRASTSFVAYFRKSNCWVLSDLARCLRPEDATPEQHRAFRLAARRGALLTEPWTAVLIRAFAKAGVVLLESEQMLPSFAADRGNQVGEALRRADDCVQALWHLGRKSDVALSVANILGEDLKRKRYGAEEKLGKANSSLAAGAWLGFEQDQLSDWNHSSAIKH